MPRAGRGPIVLREDIEILRCPRCRGRLRYEGRAPAKGPVESAGLGCVGCRARYRVSGGVPRFVSDRGLGSEERQSRKSFSAKWRRQRGYGIDSPATRRFQHEWYLRRYGFRTEARLRAFLRGKERILDAGTGLGRDTFRYAELGTGRVFGLDFSTSIDSARKRPHDRERIAFVQGDVLALPFASRTFDFAVSDKVLSNVADTRLAVRELVRVTRPGGHLAFYVYRRRGPIREFANDYLREHLGAMSPARAWKECRAITALGKALSDLHATIHLEHDIPLLGIKAGRHDVQRLVYYDFLKCFWNEDHTFEENNLVNFDWYHPAFTWRYDEDDVRRWVREHRLAIVHLDRAEPSGISVLCKKPG